MTLILTLPISNTIQQVSVTTLTALRVITCQALIKKQINSILPHIPKKLLVTLLTKAAVLDTNLVKSTTPLLSNGIFGTTTLEEQMTGFMVITKPLLDNTIQLIKCTTNSLTL